MLRRREVKLLNVAIEKDASGSWRKERYRFAELAREKPAHYAWITAPRFPDFEDPDYAEKTTAELDADRRRGAVGCKIWKNIGMETREPSGAFLMLDHPIFEPLFAHMAETGFPLLLHTGEPLACWQPLQPGKPHYGYYSKHPEWHMYGKEGVPSHAEIIAARDRVLARHPSLRVVGAHLGSLEHDVAEIATRFEAFPNLAVDLSARVPDLAYQDRETVREFLIAYADRVLFGTDAVYRGDFDHEPPESRAAVVETYENRLVQYVDYLGSDRRLRFGEAEVRGLGLPEAVLRRILEENAVRWYPGLSSVGSRASSEG
jgi:predicted TIM-barrel fold metal-dependent hydrolase